MEFKDRLKKLREEKNLTRKELADKLQLTYWALSKYETGERFPDPETLNKIADFFNVSLDYLMGRTDIKDPIANIAAHRTNGYDEPLTEEELFAIEKFKEFLKQQKREKENKQK